MALRKLEESELSLSLRRALAARRRAVRRVVLTPEQQLKAVERVYPDLVRKPKEK